MTIAIVVPVLLIVGIIAWAIHWLFVERHEPKQKARPDHTKSSDVWKRADQ